MKKYGLIAVGVLIILISSPVFTLTSLTNLSVLADGTSGSNQNIYLYSGPQLSGDTYDFGNCTYWVYLLRAQIGDPIPNTWGNAITWADRAAADGYVVDHSPSYSAIMQDPNAPGGFGHVAFVESVDATTGSWTISEMNRVGFDEVDTRVMPAGTAASYNFIHDRQ